MQSVDLGCSNMACSSKVTSAEPVGDSGQRCYLFGRCGTRCLDSRVTSDLAWNQMHTLGFSIAGRDGSVTHITPVCAWKLKLLPSTRRRSETWDNARVESVFPKLQTISGQPAREQCRRQRVTPIRASTCVTANLADLAATVAVIRGNRRCNSCEMAAIRTYDSDYNHCPTSLRTSV